MCRVKKIPERYLLDRHVFFLLGGFCLAILRKDPNYAFILASNYLWSSIEIAIIDFEIL